MTPESLSTALEEKARTLGFDLVGATRAVAPPDLERLQSWLADGMAGEMQYFSRRMDAYRDPGSILPGVKSILMLGVNYRTVEPAAAVPGHARISRYAWGRDYHDIIRRKLRAMARFHDELVRGGKARGVVDTAPLLERSFASRAGLGWVGKNTLLINEEYGSWIFLAALLTTEILQYHQPAATDHCGSCRACLDACPTGALEGPYRLNARKCISYLTIESRGPVAEELKRACGDRLFGCDACQEACPWNRRTLPSSEEGFQPLPGANPVSLADVCSLDEAGFRERFGHTPLRRIGLAGLMRNARMAMENVPNDDAANRGFGPQ